MAIVEVNLVELIEPELDFKIYGSFSGETPSPIPESPSPQFLFRARLGEQYVYFSGEPPPGATDIVIMDGPKTT